MIDDLLVKKDDPISAAKWNRLVRLVWAQRIGPGYRTLPVRVSGGTAVNVGPMPTWDHPWRVILGAELASVQKGTVNGLEPTIGDFKQKISDPNAFVNLSTGGYDSTGKGWIALELRMSPGYTDIETAQVIHVANLTNDESVAQNRPSFSQGILGMRDRRVRYPLARLSRIGTVVSCWQIAYFNLSHKPKPSNDEKGVARHFFWPT